MSWLDPQRLFRYLAKEIPRSLHRDIYIVGSLAAAYHYRSHLGRRAVNTKDADVVVQPAGNFASSKDLALTFLDHGWRPTRDTVPGPKRTARNLRAIRLYPPKGGDYFVEILGLPRRTQAKMTVWTPWMLPDGWYALPSHRFMGVTSVETIASTHGLRYAHPATMALSNLLSHPHLGTQRIESGGGYQGLLRSSKDLGRVLALAWLEGPTMASWIDIWRDASKRCYGARWRAIARKVPSGLDELLDDPAAFREAHESTVIGLLAEREVSADALRAVAVEFQETVVRPFLADR